MGCFKSKDANVQLGSGPSHGRLAGFNSKEANVQLGSGPSHGRLPGLSRSTTAQPEVARQVTLGAGLWRGKPPGYEDPFFLSEQTAFSVSEVEALYDLFIKLSRSVVDDGFIHKEQFLYALFKNVKRESFIANRVFALFDAKGNGVIEFGEFVRALSIFHPNAPIEDKAEFSFNLHDVGQKGFISREDVKSMLTDVLLETDLELPDETIETILDRTFEEADTKHDGLIDKQEWKDFLRGKPKFSMRYLTLEPYLKDITATVPGFVFNSEVEVESHCQANLNPLASEMATSPQCSERTASTAPIVSIT